MTKSELKQLIRECVKEELGKSSLTEGRVAKGGIDQLLVTSLQSREDFIEACESGNAEAIMRIVDSVIAENNLRTPGATNVRNTIFYKTRGNKRVPRKVGEDILQYVWNCYLSAEGDAVIA
jgi:hypothetical protein